MSNEFYNYIAKRIFSFFQSKADTIHPGERYCLKVDTDEMTNGINSALEQLLSFLTKKGVFNYKNVYETYTIRLSQSLEVVVAAKIDGMTDDFLATLRNAELTNARFPILMITSSTIDTITSGTGDLSAKGMPFHSQSIVKKIGEDIEGLNLPVSDKILLEEELKRKQSDRFSDKSSLYEYSNLLTVIGCGHVEDNDFPLFELLPDSEMRSMRDSNRIKERINDNHFYFEEIDHIFKHGNINEDLSSKYNKTLITHLQKCKKDNTPWYIGVTFNDVKKSHEQIQKQIDNPLSIVDDDFQVYSESILEYPFLVNEKVFIRDDGTSKAKARIKNILIFNPDKKEHIIVEINTNKIIRSSMIEPEPDESTCRISSTKIFLFISPTGCTFSQIKVKDLTSNITFKIRICVIDLPAHFLESFQTCYTFEIPTNINKSVIKLCGINNSLIINPGCEDKHFEQIHPNSQHECNSSYSLYLNLIKEDIDTDTGYINCSLKVGPITIPIQIQDEVIKPVELTGSSAFKLKFSEHKSLEYRNKKIVLGTKEYFAKETFSQILLIEKKFIDTGATALIENSEGDYQECELCIPDGVRSSYKELIRCFKELKTLPSLSFYSKDGKLLSTAEQYVKTVEDSFSSIEVGAPLNPKYNDLLLLGCVIKQSGEHSIYMSPLQPLNILYQIFLSNEEEVGEVRDNLINRLTPLYLLPYIKDSSKKIYHAVEKGELKNIPEWRAYAPVSNQRYSGARGFVSKLVCDKIIQYQEHFAFLFEGLQNNKFYINLVNMGDCREVFEGIIKYYANHLNNNIEELLCFTINIYSETECYNEFNSLSNPVKLKNTIRESGYEENLNELFLILIDKVKCFYRNYNEEKYQYAHLTFFEMDSSEDTEASRMRSITTGIALNGLISGIPSVLNAEWYKTGFGLKYAKENQLTNLAAQYNALYRVAFSGSSYEPSSCIFTEIKQGQEGQLEKLYKSSSWVIFVEPKVDLSFFKKQTSNADDLMVIHYSDQYTSASGYDDITVTQKSQQYEEIIKEQLNKKGVSVSSSNIRDIINLFNAVNGGWMLRLITAKKLAGATDSYFSREKMSILSAIKLCMAYYNHPNIVWVPISLEEMLRVSGGAGLSQKEGLLSARNLGFEQRATSDDILMVGVEKKGETISVYLHPVEVKIGQNHQNILEKAREQAINTYESLWKSLWPEEGLNNLERKISRNFFMQHVITCCEKMQLYGVYPEENWNNVIDTWRMDLLNENYAFSTAMDQYIGKGTVISFATDVANISGEIQNNICLLQFPEKLGSKYMVFSAAEIEVEIQNESPSLPPFLKNEYVCNHPEETDNDNPVEDNIENSSPANQYSSNEVCSVVESSAITTPQDNEAETSEETTTENDTSLDSVQAGQQTGMKILFGTDITNNQPLYWLPNDTNQLFHTNTGIIGTMGTGKTQFTKSMIAQLYREQEHNVDGMPLGILIFDYKGDYNESKADFVNATNAQVLKPYHLPFNPFALTKPKVFKPVLPRHTAKAFAETLAKVYRLGQKQKATLLSCITKAYEEEGIVPNNPSTWENTPPTFDKVYEIYSHDDTINKNDSLAAAMDNLHDFEIFESNPQETKSLFDLLNGVIVIDLSGYTPDIQNLIVAITLDLFYSSMQSVGSSKLDREYRQLTKLILVDEADNFMSEDFPVLKKILKEGREFGVGTILSTQFLKHFGSGEDDYSKYILTWVVHNVSDLKNSDVDFVFKTDAKRQEEQTLYSDIKALQKHHSIVKIGNAKPVYIKDKAFWELYEELYISNNQQP